jgi:hypothetical protein
MTISRKAYIEMIRRQIYGDQPTSEANITVGLANRWLNIAIAAAAKQNYKDNLAIDGINYVNNSFYTTFKGIVVTKDENFLWRIELPQIPLGIGTSAGIETLVFKDGTTNEISYSVVWLSQNQRSYSRGMRAIPNKILAYSEGKYVYAMSTIMLSQYTATVTMVSGGDGTDLTSTVNVPDDYFNYIVEYMKQQLMFQRQVPQDVTNDGSDAMVTT